jgi:hypothetical protein
LLAVAAVVEVAAHQPQVGADALAVVASTLRGGSGSLTMAGRPARITCAFSRPIALAVGAQDLHVVEVDAGDDHAVGVDHVDASSRPPRPTSRITRSSAACASARRMTKVVNSNQVSGRLAAGGFHRLEVRQQCVAVDRLAVDAAALLEVHQVRLAVQPDAVAGLARDGSSMAQVEPLPLVPATTITGASKRRPRRSRSAPAGRPAAGP